MEDVNTTQRLSFSFAELRFSLLEFNSRKELSTFDQLKEMEYARGPPFDFIFSTKNEKSKDRDCKADQNNLYCFFITIFWLAIPAFFRFIDVTEFMIGITMLIYRWRMSQDRFCSHRCRYCLTSLIYRFSQG